MKYLKFTFIEIFPCSLGFRVTKNPGFSEVKFGHLTLRIYGPTPGLISDPSPFNSQIQFLILLTVNHTILIMLVQRIQYYIN